MLEKVSLFQIKFCKDHANLTLFQQMLHLELTNFFARVNSWKEEETMRIEIDLFWTVYVLQKSLLHFSHGTKRINIHENNTPNTPRISLGVRTHTRSPWGATWTPRAPWQDRFLGRAGPSFWDEKHFVPCESYFSYEVNDVTSCGTIWDRPIWPSWDHEKILVCVRFWRYHARPVGRKRDDLRVSLGEKKSSGFWMLGSCFKNFCSAPSFLKYGVLFSPDSGV